MYVDSSKWCKQDLVSLFRCMYFSLHGDHVLTISKHFLYWAPPPTTLRHQLPSDRGGPLGDHASSGWEEGKAETKPSPLYSTWQWGASVRWARGRRECAIIIQPISVFLSNGWIMCMRCLCVIVSQSPRDEGHYRHLISKYTQVGSIKLVAIKFCIT